MGSSEVFEALESGTIDGLMSYSAPSVSRDLQEIIRHGTRAHFGAYTVDAYCRTDWYDAAPPDLRAALDAAAARSTTTAPRCMAGVHERDYLPSVRERGVDLVEPSRPSWRRSGRPVAPVYGAGTT